MTENRAEIVVLLEKTLRATDMYADLVKLVYDEWNEVITAHFVGGGTRRINVAACSGWGIIKTVVEHIDG